MNASRFRLTLAVLIGACIASPPHAQTPGRVATTIEAAIAEPVFFHGRQIAIRAATVQDRAGTRIVVGTSDSGDKPKLHPVFVFWQQAPARSDGEIRGEFEKLSHAIGKFLQIAVQLHFRIISIAFQIRRQKFRATLQIINGQSTARPASRQIRANRIIPNDGCTAASSRKITGNERCSPNSFRVTWLSN